MRKFSVQSIGTATFLILFVSVLNKLLGLFKEILLAKEFGIKGIMDAFVFSQIIPYQLIPLIVSGISTAFIPMFIEKNEKEGEEEAILFSNSLLFILLLSGILLSILLFVFSPEIVKIFSPNIEKDLILLRVRMVRFFSLSITPLFLIFILSSIYKSYKHFIIPSLSTLSLNLIVIIFILTLSKKISIYAPVFGMIIGTILQFLFLLFPLFKKDFLKFSLYNKDIKKLLIFSLPIIFGNNIIMLNMLIDKFSASFLSSGYLSSLNYASRIVLVPYTFFALSLTGAIYPYISTHISKNEKEKGINILKNSLKFISLILFPSCIGLIALSNPIILLIFKRGAFDLRAVNLTSSALIYYSIGLPFFGGIMVLLRYFFSEKDNLSPLKSGVISVLLNAGLNIGLIKFLKHNGIALSTSISSIVMFFILFNYLKKKFNITFSADYYKYMLKIIFSSVVMGIFSLLLFKFLPFSLAISTISTIMVASILYLVLLKMFKVKEMDEVLKRFLKHKG